MKKYLFLFIVCVMCTSMAVSRDMSFIGKVSSEIISLRAGDKAGKTQNGEKKDKNKTGAVQTKSIVNKSDGDRGKSTNKADSLINNEGVKGSTSSSNNNNSNNDTNASPSSGSKNSDVDFSEVNPSNNYSQGSESGPQQSAQVDKQSWFSVDNFLLVGKIIVGLVAFIVIVVLYRKVNNILNKEGKNRKAIGNLTLYQENIDNRLNQLESDIRKLGQSIERLKDSTLQNQQNANLGINMNGIKNGQNSDCKTSNSVSSRVVEPQVLFLGTPYSNGHFSRPSKIKTMDSVYKLTTYDGRNGSFIFCDDSESIGTANLALTAQKAACKIKNSDIMPSRVTTVKPGQAILDNGEWIVTEKADVAFER